MICPDFLIAPLSIRVIINLRKPGDEDARSDADYLALLRPISRRRARRGKKILKRGGLVQIKQQG
jgi:hypothetical protein